jgi:predicted XRE-type DNA-binding protein
MPGPVEVAQDLPTRLRAASKAAVDAKEALQLRLKHRNRIIFEAIDDHGMSQQEVAAIVGVAKGRISAILANPDDDQ